MINKSMKKIQKLTILFCVLLFMFGSTLTVFAMNFDGTGQGSGGGSQAGQGGFLITWDSRVTGYRFSVVNKYGKSKTGTKNINVFPDAESWAHGGFTYKDYTMTTDLCNKIDVKRNFGSRGSTSAPRNCYRAYCTDDGLYNMKLPTALNNLATNLKNALNQSAANVILKKMGLNRGFSDLEQGDRVLVEPFFSVRIAYERMNLTVSEIAWIASSVCKYKQDDIPKSSGTSGTFGFICNFANGVWPRSLYVDQAVPNYWDAVNPREANISGTEAQKRNKLKFSSIVKQGYGVALLWEDVPRVVDVDVAVTNLVFCDGAKKEISNLMENTVAYLKCSVQNNSGYTVSCRVNFNINSGKNGNGWSRNYAKTITMQPRQTVTFYVPDSSIGFTSQHFTSPDFSYGTEDFKIRGSASIDTSSIKANNNKANDTNSSNNYRNTSMNYYIYSPRPSIMVDAVDGTPTINNNVYSGQRFSSYAKFQNLSYSNARFDSFLQRTFLGTTYTENEKNTYALAQGYWNVPMAIFRPKYTNPSGTVPLKLYAKAEEVTSKGHMPIRGMAGRELTVYPTDLMAYDIELIDMATRNVCSKAQPNREVQFKYTFKNNTKLPVKVAWCVEYDNAGGFQMEHTDTIAALSTKEVYGKPFRVSADKTTIEAKASIYLFDLWGNTEYEYNGANNTLTKTFDILSPFTPELKDDQKSVVYRKGTTVYTSFYIKNNADADISSVIQFRDGPFGQVGENPIATISVYRDARKTQLIHTTDVPFCIPKGNEPTLVWVRWDVPIDCPDTVYIECICDSKNVFSTEEFNDNLTTTGAFNMKNVYCTVKTEFPIITNTPDTCFTKTVPTWLGRTPVPGGYSSNVSLKENLYAKEGDMKYGRLSWNYFAVENNAIVKKTDFVNVKSTYTNILPAGSPSANIIDKDNIEMKSGYGFSLNADALLESNAADYTQAQSAYTIFPEFLYLATSDNITNAISNVTTSKKITDFVTAGSGFDEVQRMGIMFNPKSGGSYATYATLVRGKEGFKLPANDTVNDNVHFTPIWYPNGHYKVYTYYGDIWTPAGMLTGISTSNTITIKGNMYEDFVISEWQGGK